MKNFYIDYKEKLQKEFDNFPMFFAFSEKQFKEGVAKLGFDNEDKSLKGVLVSIGAGGHIRTSDKQAYMDLVDKMHKRLKTALKDENFLLEALIYEMNNYEFSYSGNFEEILNSLGLEEKKLTEKQKAVCVKAKKEYFETIIN